MMRNEDLVLASEIEQKLIDFSYHIPLPGINKSEDRKCLVEQIIDSTRRIKYITTIREHTFSSSIADPSNSGFNPLKAALWYKNENNIDESYWLLFLFVHFGKHHVYNWDLVRAIYGGLKSGVIWDWETTSANPEAFSVWLSSNQSSLQKNGRFGNHRKYESLKANTKSGTDSVIRSYVDWVKPFGNHFNMMQNAKKHAGKDTKRLFNYLYKSMNKVHRFGRTAKFDYLSMVGKIGLENIEPGSAYTGEATGPYRGASLLFSGDVNSKKISAKKLESYLGELNDYLNLYFGWQVLEDSLCNWQKSPDKYIHFKG